MVERMNRVRAKLNGGPPRARRWAEFGLAYLLFFAAIFSAAHEGHAKGAALDPLHAIVCAVDNQAASTPLTPASAGPDQDFSCCTLGFAPLAVLSSNNAAPVAPWIFASFAKIRPPYETQEGFPVAAPGMSRAPPFVV